MRLVFRRILLATDSSEEAELATRVAVELANSTGSELHVMHVKLVPLTPPYPEVLDWREDLEYAEREARELLDEQVKKVEDAGGIVARVHLREEQPAEEIIALAEELGADLIVVGRRHRGRIRRALAGSVSDWVVRHARCPVLVVGAGGRLADNRARLSRGTWTARSETSKKASARR
jgi:nucleotide-binding universal stress UspA family protein